ncbi:MAG: YIP1 family protein [Clostridia bacterium]|nr:YIP1 family protein [Clostridia bacterium]
MKKASKIFLVAFCALLIFGALPVSAVEPYQTYTYSSEGYALWSPAAYTPLQEVDSGYIGLYEAGDGVPLSDPADIETDSYGNVYISDTKNSRVVVMNEYYKLKFILDVFVNENGSKDQLKEPKGLFVNDDYIYVCDTGNKRIVVFNREDGSYHAIIKEPKSSLFGEDSIYTPVACAVDQYGQVFVVSSTTYQGVILMTQDGTFTGFIGAQKVVYDIFDIIWRRFMTEEQKKRQSSYVSTEFNNLTIDSDGFVYVTTASIDPSKQISSIESKSADYSPVKKLNAAGDEIMKRNGFFDPGGEVDINTKSDATISGPSTIVDVAVGEEGSWSIIDSKRNKIYTYDQNGNLLFAFGDSGMQLGNLASITAVSYQGSNLLVLDALSKSFTVYRRTDYGDLLIDALHYENIRDYDGSIEAWKGVLRHNNNFDSAYIGVGKALYRDSKYEEAMEYFKAAYDASNYSDAYKEVRKGWIEDYFFLIILVPLVIVVAWVFFKKYVKKVNYQTSITVGKRTYIQELFYAFHLMYHPFDGFWDLKHEKRGSVRAAATYVALTIVAFYYQSVGTGYIANPTNKYSTIIVQILAVGVPLVLFVVANWCLTTLFDGEGSFKDIFISAGYALSPMPLLIIVSTLLSNILTEEEMAISTMLVTIAFIWAALLLFFGMAVTHDYTMGKNMITILGTILAMAIIMFVAILFTSLIAKIVSFVSSLIIEIGYRIE